MVALNSPIYHVILINYYFQEDDNVNRIFLTFLELQSNL